jgi:hypothetical protein
MLTKCFQIELPYISSPTPRAKSRALYHGGFYRVNAITIAYSALSADTPTENLRSAERSLLFLLAAHSNVEATDLIEIMCLL